MRAIDLLDAIGDARSDYIQEAQRIREAGPARRRFSKAKLLLIAAAISILLAGCTYAYLKLQDMKVGEYINPDNGERHDLVYTRDIPGSPAFQAVQEWMEFEESYDRDESLLRSCKKAAYSPPIRYESIICYTQEMQDTIDAICEKYDLQLLGKGSYRHSYDATRDFFDDIGIRDIHLEGAAIDTELYSGYYYEDGSFTVYGLGTLRDGEADWPGSIDYIYGYAKKGSFCTFLGSVGHIEDYRQWNYVTKSGANLLLALGPERAYIWADCGDAIIEVTVMNPTFEGRTMPPQALQALADTFDYAVHTDPLPIPAFTYADMIEQSYSVPSVYDQYALADLDGDGTEELLTGQDGFIDIIAAMEEGVAKIVWFSGDAACHLSENGVIVDTGSEEGKVCTRILQFDGGRLRYLEYLEYEDNPDCKWGRSQSLGDFPKVDAIISEEECQEILNRYPKLDLDWKPITQFPGADLREAYDGPSYMSSEEEQLTQRMINILGSDPRYFEGSRIFYDGKVYQFQAIGGNGDYKTVTPIGQLIYNRNFPQEDKITDFLDNDRCEVQYVTGGLTGEALWVNRGNVCTLLYLPTPEYSPYYTEYEYRDNDDGSVTITKYRCSEAYLVVPMELDGKPVTAIDGGAEGAFAHNPYLKSVYIQEGVKFVGDNSFEGCYNLTEVFLPKSLEGIGHCAFQACPQLKCLYFEGDAPAHGNYILDAPDEWNPYFTHIFYHENAEGWDGEDWANYDRAPY